MTLTMVNWLDRLLAVPRASSRGENRSQPMKITVERLPDYLWRELGFQQPVHQDDGPWPRS